MSKYQHLVFKVALVANRSRLYNNKNYLKNNYLVCNKKILLNKKKIKIRRILHL